jgi:hypothetical protein
MARRITTAVTASQQKTINPYSQPCFTTYTMNYSHGGGYHCYDHNFNICAHSHGTGDSQYASFRTYSTAASEFFESTNSYWSTRTDDHTSSNNGWWCNFISSVGYLGHMSQAGNGGRGGNEGGWNVSGRDNGMSYRAYAFRDNACLVNETHQDYAIFQIYHGQDRSELICGPRSSTTYYHFRHRMDHTQRARIPYQWEDANGADNYNQSYYGTYGGACYNAKTQKFVTIYADNNGRWKPIVYNDCPDFRTLAHTNMRPNTDSLTGRNHTTGNEVYDYFNTQSNATQYDQSSWSGYNNLSGHDEARRRCAPVMCDNGKVVIITQIPHWGTIAQRWNSNGTYESGNNYTYGMSHTTSYGFEQGQQYGIRWQCTSDGRYMWAYAPSYYYGCGAQWYCVRVSDGKILQFHTTDSTYSRQPFPMGKSGMGWFYSYNTDGGSGMMISQWEMDEEFTMRNDGDTIPLDNNFIRYVFEPGTYSTSYGCIIPCMYDTSLFSDPHIPSRPE